MGQTPWQAYHGETILVVEDAEAIRKMVCLMLTQCGYRCLEASDGAEALRLLDDATQVELVLTDMVMPNMGGSDLARHLSRMRPGLPIVFMSGYTEDPVVRAVERSTSVFLPKPFTAEVLKEKVREALARPWSAPSESQSGSVTQ